MSAGLVMRLAASPVDVACHPSIARGPGWPPRSRQLRQKVVGRTMACLDERPCNLPNSQRFSRPVRSSSTEAYWPVTPISCRTWSAGDERHSRRSWRSHCRSAAEWPASAASWSCRAVWSENTKDLALAHDEVDAVDGASRAKALHEPMGIDGKPAFGADGVVSIVSGWCGDGRADAGVS